MKSEVARFGGKEFGREWEEEEEEEENSQLSSSSAS